MIAYGHQHFYDSNPSQSMDELIYKDAYCRLLQLGY